MRRRARVFGQLAVAVHWPWPVSLQVLLVPRQRLHASTATGLVVPPPAEYVFTAHLRQLFRLGALLYVPTGQGPGPVMPLLGQWKPLVHAWHAVALANLAKVPGEQRVQAVAFALGAALPALQLVQEVERDLLLKVPGWQMEHC